MTVLQAAISVLESSDRPMTTAEIPAEVLRRELIASNGKTPVATMASCLYVGWLGNPKTRFIRLAEPGRARARRGSVRWTLKASVTTLPNP